MHMKTGFKHILFGYEVCIVVSVTLQLFYLAAFTCARLSSMELSLSTFQCNFPVHQSFGLETAASQHITKLHTLVNTRLIVLFTIMARVENITLHSSAMRTVAAGSVCHTYTMTTFSVHIKIYSHSYIFIQSWTPMTDSVVRVPGYTTEMYCF
jgi:hypothetical protein